MKQTSDLQQRPMRAYSTASGGVVFVPDTLCRKNEQQGADAQKPIQYTIIAAEEKIEALDIRPLTRPSVKTIVKRLAQAIGR